MAMRLFAFLLALLPVFAGATNVGILSQPQKGTVYLDVAIPVVGSPGTYWPQLTNIFVPTGSVGTAVIVLHGGSGDNLNNPYHYRFIRNLKVNFNITGATWSNTHGGQVVFNVSSDPTASIIPGRNITVSGVTPTQYNASFRAIAVTSTTVTVPTANTGIGTYPPYQSGGVVSSLTATNGSTNWNTANEFNAVFAWPQGQFPQGSSRADTCNTASITGYINDLVLTATSLTGAIEKNQTVTGTGVSSGTTITGQVSGNAYDTGTYNVSPSQTVGSPTDLVTLTSNGNSFSPNATTWCNWAMNSGVNDMQFLSDLKSYIHTTYNIPLSRFGLLGHSNGGMMAERVMMENTGLFKWYGMLSGPQSIIYNYQPVTPSTYDVKAMWMFGDEDNVLCYAGYSPGCTNTPIAFTGYIAGTVLHVTSVSTGTINIGENVVAASGSVTALRNGTYITAQESTAGGDVATYTISLSQTVPTEAMNASNTFDAETSQNVNNATGADVQYPSPMTWNTVPTTAAYWAVNSCNPSSLDGRTTINPADAVTTTANIGVERTWSYCAGTIVVHELSNSNHSVVQLQKNSGENPLFTFMLFIKAN